MPEYLAPGVYVEETSFRSKSIEGVGTSTTGFVGPTLKGPLEGTPELITNFSDFQRLYGGVDALQYGGKAVVNYLAHSVAAFFNEGGARLYVARVFQAANENDPGIAVSADLLADAADKEVRFKARFRGAIGKGTISVRQVLSPATKRAMERAPEGTLALVGDGTAAQLVGGKEPFLVPSGNKLKLQGANLAVEIELKGTAVEASAGDALADPVPLTADNNQLRVKIDGVEQVIVLPPGNVAPPALVSLINTRIRGGYARLEAGKLVIGSDTKGRKGAVTVTANAVFGFAADVAVSGQVDANNVGDINRVTIDEIDALLKEESDKVRAVRSGDGKLQLVTTAKGEKVTLKVDGAADDSAHSALGLNPAEEAKGKGKGAAEVYLKVGNAWQSRAGVALDLGTKDDEPPEGRADFLTVALTTTDGEGQTQEYDELGLDPKHPRWMGSVLDENPKRRADALRNAYAITVVGSLTGHDMYQALFPAGADNTIQVATGGLDGIEPNAKAYEDALKAFETLEDISIVAAPGATTFTQAQGIQNALISHAEKRRAYRIAVLDTPPDTGPTAARELRGKFDSTHAALYYPWVVVPNPLARAGNEQIPREIALPPSGFVCGIYARNDVNRGVFKAPANEVVRGALRFESDINFAQQEVLNPLGINCLRYLSGRGYRVWGARTVSSDPEWKYVNVRRYFNYLEASIDRGTQWAVFEPNGERLWANIRETITSFLLPEWTSGALLGKTAEEAFFVRCDRSTMTQNDLDNGRLICLIGVAVVKPAEFVIFRIGQKTADSRN